MARGSGLLYLDTRTTTPIRPSTPCPQTRYLAPLFDSGALSRDRILLKPLADLHLATISADSVFTLANSHFSGPTEGDATFRLARVSYGGGSVPLEVRHPRLDACTARTRPSPLPLRNPE